MFQLFVLLTVSTIVSSTVQTKNFPPSNGLRMERGGSVNAKRYENANFSSPTLVRYHQVSPKLQDNHLAGVGRFNGFRTESGGSQTRHLEWFHSSEDESEIATGTEKGLLEEFFEEDDDDDDDEDEGGDDEVSEKNDDIRQHHRKRYTKVDKMIFPLLLAYKLKFFTMVPLLIGALALLVTTTGLAGFFFALFAAATGLHVKGHH